MLTLTHWLNDGGCARSRWRRLLDDLGMTVVVCAWIAVVTTLVGGRPQTLYQDMVSTLCVGLVAMTMLNVVRVRFWVDPTLWGRWRVPYLMLILATAPVAHYVGCVLAGRILGTGFVSLADYLRNPRQLNMILLTLLGICAVVLMSINRERLDRIKVERSEARARADTIERQALLAQLRLLQAQIEPHMLFNTLANLQGLIAIDPQQASTMLDHLIGYLRATLSATRRDSTTLGQEFDAAETYLALMAVRMGTRLTYRCELPDALRTARLPPLLLQPLVENAIIHGLEPDIDGGAITIAAREQDGRLAIEIGDTGIGLLAHGTTAKGGGIGMSTTRERLHALYGERAALELVPALPRGVLARLTLPLECA